MKNKDIDAWVVIEGKLTFTCTTRKQARAFVKKNRVKRLKYSYVGKCASDYTKIILDV